MHSICVIVVALLWSAVAVLISTPMVMDIIEDITDTYKVSKASGKKMSSKDIIKSLLPLIILGIMAIGFILMTVYSVSRHIY